MTTLSADANLTAALRARRSPRAYAFRPCIFNLFCPEDADAVTALLENDPGIELHDELVPQVAELVHARTPTQKRDSARDAEVCAAFLAGRDATAYGRWVYYPWRRSLVHVLPEAEFVELRAARNQLHVTPEEQRRLRQKCVGIVGLSVGFSMAVTMALEGVGGRFRLADFDKLELSNTNRVGAGLTALGQNKAVLAARSMFETDPYLQIDVFEDGVHEANAAQFFERDGRLDLLVEECDDLPMKLRLRELARTLGVPVITETSQRGLLDVERFDLEPTRAPFHGLMGNISAAELSRLSTRDKAPFLLRFLRGTEGMSTTLAASLVEIERSLAGWPQLASAVALGGAVVTDAARRLLLGSLRRSGRFQVDMEAIVNDDAQAELREAESEAPPARTLLPPVRARARVHSEDERLERWVHWATLAPSGGNAQPWQFEEQHDGSLHCRLALRAGPSALDPDARAARVACGAAFTNLKLAAAQEGWSTTPTWEPDPRDPTLLFHAHFERDAARPDPLAQFVPLRCTNRRVGPRSELSPQQYEALVREAEESSAGLIVQCASAALDGIGQVLGELERVRMFSLPLYTEMMAELADAPDAAAGIALATLELSAADRAALQILRRRDVVSLLRREQRGAALLDLSQKPVRAASAVCMLHSAGESARSALLAGAALQRVWLRAQQLGLALQPISAGLYMLQQLQRRESALPDWERVELTRLRAPFERWFPLPSGHRGALVFRLFEAEAPSARSSRLPLASVLRRYRDVSAAE